MTAYDIIANLESLESSVKQKAQDLELSLAQVDEYQRKIQELRKQILQEEQQLRLVMAPTYSPNNREKASAEQQVRFNALLGLHSILNLFRSCNISLDVLYYYCFS